MSSDLVRGPKRESWRKAVNVGAKKRDVGSCLCRNKTIETGLQNDVFCIFVDFVSSEIYKKQMMP